MQAMAPGRSLALHAGHSVGVPEDDGLELGAALVDCDVAGVGEGARPPAGAPPGGRVEAPPTTNGFLHPGQRTCLPAELSGTCICLVQWGQLMTCGMTVS